MTHFLRTSQFWAGFMVTALVAGLFFAWELDALQPYVPGPIRPAFTTEELVFSILIVLLLSLDTGLFLWRRAYGSCPSGVKRATGIASIFGALTLLCPACTVLPLALLGGGFTLAFLTPFLPLLRLIAILILAVVTWMLWPRR